jgi:hypothetical protein
MNNWKKITLGELAGQMEEEVKLNKAIKKNLEGLYYGL